MAILPSGITEDKVHRQLCNCSTCQWNVFRPSYCKNTVHYGHHANASTFLVIGKSSCGQLELSFKAVRELKRKKKGKAHIIISTSIANLNCRAGLRKRGREIDEEVRGQTEKGMFLLGQLPLQAADIHDKANNRDNSLIIHCLQWANKRFQERFRHVVTFWKAQT